MAPDELEGRLAALELALVIALGGRPFNSLAAQQIVSQETTEARLPEKCASEARNTLERIFCRASRR
jgi:hypothetical protein